jgi:hypothetical protein
MLRGGYKFEATWMTDHIDLAKQHWKKRCPIVLFWWQKTHFLLPCQFRFARLFLVKITPLCRYNPNTFIRNRIFNFKACYYKFYQSGISGWISALYMEASENLLFSWRFQQNSSCPVYKWIFANHRSKAFQDTSLWPDKSLLNDTFGGEVSKTMAIVSPLWRIILYNARYCSRRKVAPSYPSSQNLISSVLNEKGPYRPKKNFFVAIFIELWATLTLLVRIQLRMIDPTANQSMATRRC